MRETISAFRRAPVLASLSAAMVGLALFVVGLFALAAHNLRLAFDTLEERVEVVAYLRDNATSREISDMRETLAALPEVSAVEFVTKDQALAKARRELPEFQEVMSDLAVNPLPASLEMQLHPEARTQAGVEGLAQQAGLYPFVEDVEYGEEWVSKLFMLRRIGGLTAIVLGGAFGLVATLIIGGRCPNRRLRKKRGDQSDATGGCPRRVHPASVPHRGSRHGGRGRPPRARP